MHYTLMEPLSTSMKVQGMMRIVSILIFMPLLLHLPAGDLYWINGWIYTGFIFLFGVLAYIWLSKNPDLYRERMKGNFSSDQPKSDKILMIFLTLFSLLIFPLAGLDYRFKWSNMNIYVNLLGYILIILGIYFLYFVMKENAFLSRIVHKQEKQQVVSTGPYSIVRHPMYSAVIIFYIATGLILASYYSLILIALIIGIIYIRAINEEKFLKVELEGYPEYMTKVKKRLIPLIL